MVEHPIQFGLSTHKGTKKEWNEDHMFARRASLATGKEMAIMVVADGMGGYQGGAKASRFVIDAISELWNQRVYDVLQTPDPLHMLSQELNELLHAVNSQLIHMSAVHKMGTTVSILVLYEGYYLVCHVGDCRIYQLRKFKDDTSQKPGELSLETKTLSLDVTETLPMHGKSRQFQQVTEDQSWVQQQVKLGFLNKAEADYHPKRNILLQCLGVESQIVPYLRVGTYEANDLFFLCSDGFYTVFPEDEIERLLLRLLEKPDVNLQQVCEQLICIANEHGTKDNVSVGLVTQPIQTRKRARFFHLFSYIIEQIKGRERKRG
ncbi:PP2C family protein-serine/threonine phosphatase [Bacillus alkalicellulosilyticus]|uniref:PP2C family protein-serine/threonine phosphatase n=1 Tax=Alkalihalobacterium alkalicellulosilyticum TaxID=1912214 RepID=UPI0009962198|nr:protein phosphatase 2C domain-containing protein [Bacillus alkalicellulosilyticus]